MMEINAKSNNRPTNMSKEHKIEGKIIDFK